MSDWVWVGADVAIALHDRQLAEHGGPGDVRDRGALESALARPIDAAASGEIDIATLAASYGFGIARNHPFVDGNRRTAWVIMRFFLKANGRSLTFDKRDAVRTVLALADGSLSHEALGEWLRAHLNGEKA